MRNIIIAGLCLLATGCATDLTSSNSYCFRDSLEFTSVMSCLKIVEKIEETDE